ncbi:glutamic acid-rich protein-like [Bombus impatiens]|uniref:Glutamic acid-rich protein-like n=1 Tax=Bombus impatiens TaxID=132113 RepID=A0A6P8L1B3_BOMIM|nr:glutamic acid-rich protein-like [Bombus impatiens]
MANVGDERLSGEEGSTLEELRRGRSTGGEELTGQRDLGNVQRAERDCNEDENFEKMNTKELKERLASLGLKTTEIKVELRARLQAAMDGNDTSSEKASDDESEDEDDKKMQEDEKESDDESEDEDDKKMQEDTREVREGCIRTVMNIVEGHVLVRH